MKHLLFSLLASLSCAAHVFGLPTLSSVTPDHGSVAGGTLVTFVGQELTPGMQVTIGGVPASSVTVVSSTLMTAVAPAHVPASVPVALVSGTSPIATPLIFQYAKPRSMAGSVWSELTGMAAGNDPSLVDVAVSANGDIIAGLNSGGVLLRSTDGGGTWASLPVGWVANTMTMALYSSGNGSRLVALGRGVPLRVSTDGGTTWTDRDTARWWAKVAGSADGMRLIATARSSPDGTMPGGVATSADGGVTWAFNTGVTTATSLACSADGMLAVAVDSPGNFFRSTDGGVTWTTTPALVEDGFAHVACSADGQRIFAMSSQGRMHRSFNGGLTWSSQMVTTFPISVACSADGTRLAVGTWGGPVVRSFDGGNAWYASGAPAGTWHRLAMSADGSRMAGATTGPRLWLSTGFVQPLVMGVTPTSGSILGGNSITITGEDFTGATGGSLGGTPLQDFSVVNATTITATAPPHAEGWVEVRVDNPDLFGHVPAFYQYRVPPPEVTAILPAAGSVDGGTVVTVVGKYFQPGSQVYIGGVLADVRQVVGSTMLRAIAPAHAAGVAPVLVSNADGFSTSSVSFTYTERQRGAAGQVWNAGTATGLSAAPVDVAMSADGQRVAVLTALPELTVSLDGGATWQGRTVGTFLNVGRALCTAADGGRLFLAGGFDKIHVSLDFGATWLPTTARVAMWEDIACSADGMKVVAIAFDGSVDRSSDGGLTWTTVRPAPTEGDQTGKAVCSSADGLLLAIAPQANFISTSDDGGQTWTQRTSGPFSINSLACSADGQRLYAATDSGGVSYSLDRGLTWVSSLTGSNMQSVSCSADGLRVVAARTSTGLFISADGGVQWQPFSSNLAWISTAISADGSRMAATAHQSSDGLWLSQGFYRPTVNSVAPTQGTTHGQTAITITGSDFLGSTGGSLGGAVLTDFTVVNDTTITAKTPPHAPGLVSVDVTNPSFTGSKANAFEYVKPAPVISTVTPITGSVLGGTSVTVTGTDFTGVATVIVGGTTASFAVVDDSTITLTTPAGVAGPADMTFLSPRGNTTRTGSFTYIIPPPVIDGLSSVSGPIEGGSLLTVAGRNFIDVTKIVMGGVSILPPFPVIDPTSVRFFTPPHAPGSVTVEVHAAGGIAVSPVNYIYTAPPLVITGMTPASGPSSGGTTVTFSGTGLSGVTVVLMGGVTLPGWSWQIVSDTELRLTTPAYSAGSLSAPITFFTVDNPSLPRSAGTFTYQLAGIHQWRQTWFGSPENSGPGADTATPYHNGLPNILVYALLGPGQNPATAQLADLPQVSTFGGQRAYVLTRPAGVLGVTYRAEWSHTLAPGSWQPIPDTGSGSQMIFLLPDDDQRQFSRITVTMP